MTHSGVSIEAEPDRKPAEFRAISFEVSAIRTIVPNKALRPDNWVSMTMAHDIGLAPCDAL